MPKRLHEMNDLRDMGRFPLPVYLGATGNVLLSVCLFYWLHGRADGNLAMGFPAAVVLVLFNLAPVGFLRALDQRAGRGRETSEIGRMNFFTDQHRFATWVYAVASGNLFFWLMLTWAALSAEHSLRVLAAIEALAFLCTFAPAWLQLLRGAPRLARTQ